MAHSYVLADVAVNVVANTATGLYVLPVGGNLSDGDQYMYGFFDEASFTSLSASQKQDYTVVNSLFSGLGSGTINASGEIFSLGNSHPIPSAPTEPQPGSLLTMWVFDSGVAPSSSAWGIFSSSSWVMPNDLGTVSLTSSLIDNIIVGSSSGSNYALAPVPEPASYALFVGILGLGLTVLRRRRR